MPRASPRTTCGARDAPSRGLLPEVVSGSVAPHPRGHGCPAGGLGPPGRCARQLVRQSSSAYSAAKTAALGAASGGRGVEVGGTGGAPLDADAADLPILPRDPAPFAVGGLTASHRARRRRRVPAGGTPARRGPPRLRRGRRGFRTPGGKAQHPRHARGWRIVLPCALPRGFSFAESIELREHENLIFPGLSPSGPGRI